MTTELRQMTENEFDTYIEAFIPDYAEDLSKNFLLPIDSAMDESKQLIKTLLPDKQDSNMHSICNIYSVEESNPSAYHLYKKLGFKTASISMGKTI